MSEIWAPIPNFLNYQASNDGRVRRVEGETFHILTGCVSEGYRFVHTSIDGKPKKLGVHRAVCLAFLGLPPALHQAAHNNGNPLDNSLGNLRWATASENAIDRSNHGNGPMGERNPKAKLTSRHVSEIRASTLSDATLSKLYGVSRVQIWRIKRGKCWPVDVSTLQQEAERIAA